MKAVFDELHYALSVEWDQKDPAFYQAQMEKFSASVKAANVSNQALIEETLSQVKDEKLAKELRTAFTMISINKMSSSEAQSYVRDVMNKSYSRGASWNGSGGMVVGLLVILVIVAAVALASGNARVTDDCVEAYSCEDYCTAGVCYEDCGYSCI